MIGKEKCWLSAYSPFSTIFYFPQKKKKKKKKKRNARCRHIIVVPTVVFNMNNHSY